MPSAYPRATRRSRHAIDFQIADTLGNVDQALTGRAGPTASLTRATLKTTHDLNGTLGVTPYGLPAHHWAINNSTGLRDLCWRLEGAAVNAVTAPNDLSNGAWTLTTATASLTATGPNMIVNSATIFTATSTAANAVAAGATLTAAAKQTATFHVKAGTAAFMFVGDVGDAATHTAWINMATGAAATLSGCTIQKLTALSGGWYVVTIAYTATNSYTASLKVGLADADNSASVTSGKTGLFYGIMSVANAAAGSSFISGTRNADVAYLDLAGTALATPRESTWYVKFIEMGTATILNGRVIMIGDATTAGTATLFAYSSGSGSYIARFYFNGSAANSVCILGGGIALNDQVEWRLYVSPAGALTVDQSINGATATTQTGIAYGVSASYASTKLGVNGNFAGASPGLLGLQAIKADIGNQTLTYMRA